MRACPAGPNLAVQNMTGGVVGIPPPTGRAIQIRNGAKPGRIADCLRGGNVWPLRQHLNWQPDGAPQSRRRCVPLTDIQHVAVGAQSVSALRTAPTFDPWVQVLISHGLYKLVTPYFTSKIVLDQLPPAFAGQAYLLVIPGGHGLYTRDVSHARLRDEGEVIAGSATAPCKRPNGSRP